MYFTPKRAARAALVASHIRLGILNVLFRPSLLQKAALKGAVGGCAFFSCRIDRTLRLSRSRHGVVASYLGVVHVRLRQKISGRDGALLMGCVRLLLGCYVHFCRHRFTAHDRSGHSILAHFRKLLSSCFRNRLTRHSKLPAIGCFTSGLYLSSGCFKSVFGGRANGAPRRCVRRGIVRLTGRQVSSEERAIDEMTCSLKFRCPRRFYQLFGGHINYAPGRCQTRGLLL